METSRKTTSTRAPQFSLFAMVSYSTASAAVVRAVFRSYEEVSHTTINYCLCFPAISWLSPIFLINIRRAKAPPPHDFIGYLLYKFTKKCHIRPSLLYYYYITSNETDSDQKQPCLSRLTESGKTQHDATSTGSLPPI